MKGIWEIIKVGLKFVQGLGTTFMGLFVILFIFMIYSAMTNTEPRPTVPNGVVMVLSPSGVVREQIEYPDPLEQVFREYQDFNSTPPQSSYHEIIKAVERATTDSRIAGLAILTDRFAGASPAHLHGIADRIKAFKEAGKPVYAISSAYSQSDYLLASQADKVFMNPEGNVILTGYGRYGTYFKSLLDMIGADINVFRVGTFKSAVEPYIRDDMSAAAKEANQAYLGELWRQYTDKVEQGRGMEPGTLAKSVDETPDLLRAAGGNFGQLAVDMGLVDELVHRIDYREALIEEFGATPDGETFKQISYQAYLAASHQADNSKNKIAVITAQGEIIMGTGPITVAAAETVVSHIRAARNDENVAAIVLRVDSPGGSSFASELIRQELEAAQKINGLPVVASFGPVAASGGYWISATADEIWASPSTITGSIGIFGVIPTFQDTLDKVGIHTDGVGTTKLSGAFDITRDLSEPTKDIIQQSIENGYQNFLTLVANGRGMTVEEVDKIAQGRVWAATTALEYGLVDHLGTFDDAVASAAKKAGVSDYRVSFYRDAPDRLDAMLARLFQSNIFESTTVPDYPVPSPMLKMLTTMKAEADLLLKFNDPMGRYALCLTCQLR
ncbi:protease 4 [Kordiimonas sediminis]|uniref:Protease 4 n=1 Tax=Kordiimonas sediminis TaxID=1735581 RepID=A0A919AUD7_9PROT|nr:signal peptide peptidase SppA [Kordiimonas sediminis]GHF23655.1 protease 4 [Kordiimonas sediminis]